MTQKIYIVEGRQFRTEADYQNALKDQQVIENLRMQTKKMNLSDQKKLLEVIRSGKCRFHSILGQDYMEELAEEIRRQERKDAPVSKANATKKKELLKKPVKKKETPKRRQTTQKQNKPQFDEQELDKIVKEELKKREIDVQETSAMMRYSGGDARKLLNILELVVDAEPNGKVVITDKKVEERLQQNPLAYDKNGEMHYDIISAFIKSIRGSDPDAALYWLARMVEGGEDPAFIARCLVISASEDIGLANPNALLLANAAFDAVMKIGWPEGRIPLAEATVYLAASPKSNSSYTALDKAIAEVKKSGNQPVPLHLRNAPTQLMQQLGYHAGYKYAHDYKENFVRQQYLPDALKDESFWTPQHNRQEDGLRERMERLWGRKYPEK